MTIADFYPNLRHRGVVILFMVNVCTGADLLAYTPVGLSLRRFLAGQLQYQLDIKLCIFSVTNPKGHVLKIAKKCEIQIFRICCHVSDTLT